jgi:hypothetical protein
MGVIRDAMKLTPMQFAEKHPKEWALRRQPIERLMLEAAKRKMKAWNGILTSTNVWI